MKAELRNILQKEFRWAILVTPGNKSGDDVEVTARTSKDRATGLTHLVSLQLSALPDELLGATISWRGKKNLPLGLVLTSMAATITLGELRNDPETQEEYKAYLREYLAATGFDEDDLADSMFLKDAADILREKKSERR